MDETKLGVRIAVVEGGRVVHERAADQATKLTLADLGLRTSGSAQHVLFAKERSGWVLRLPAGTSGQLHARPEQAARPLDGAAPIHLGPADKGRVIIDEQTVLFQLATPAARPVAVLPTLETGPWWSRFDAPFAGLVAAFLMIEGGGALALAQRELKKEDITFESLPDRWIHLAAQPEPKKAEPAKLEPKKSEPEVAKKSEPQVAQAPEPARPAPRLTGAALKKEMEKVGVLHVLSALDADTRAATAAALGSEGIQKTASEALDGAQHVGFETGDKQVDRKDTGPRVTDIGPMDTVVDAVPQLPTAPLRRVVPKDPGVVVPTLPPGTPDQELVGHFVRQHLGALRACYEAELKRNHELAGRLKVRFTVSPLGNVSDAEVEEDGLHSLAVNSCITRRIENWHLGVHLGDEVTVSFPFIFAHE